MGKEKENRITYKEIRKNEEINSLIERGNEVLAVLGFTEHSRKHAAKVAECAGSIQGVLKARSLDSFWRDVFTFPPFILR